MQTEQTQPSWLCVAPSRQSQQHEMSGLNEGTGNVVAAQLDYLAIYNPRLGSTDETRHEQIVFYYSRTVEERRRGKGKDEHDSPTTTEEEENEKLRHVGLAQGIVEFAR